MAVLRSARYLGQMRIDSPHIKAIESGVRADFDTLVGQMLAGGRPLVVSGFVSSATVGQLATTASITTANSKIAHPLATDAGTIFQVPSDRATEVLNTTNTRVIGGFTANTVNYIGVDLRRTANSSTADIAQFLDAEANTETPESVPLADTFDYVISISTQDFSTTPTIAPLAKITTDSNNLITVVEDARNMFFRLGSGGSVTAPKHTYPWSNGRTEVGDNSDFSVADKTIGSLKDWADATMTRLWELGGGEHWYSPTADRNVKLLRTGSPMASGDWFTWDGTNLTWQGLRMVFANSTGVYNDIKDQTVSSGGLTDLTDGQCIYVDVDRTQNLTGGSALSAAKANLASLGVPTIPGSRFVIAWRSGSTVYARDSAFAVGVTSPVATTSALGIVKLSVTSGTPLAPIVFNPDVNGSLTVSATGGNASGITTSGNGTGTGISATGGGTDGIGVLGTGGGSLGSGVKGIGGSGASNGVWGHAAGNGNGVYGDTASSGNGVYGISTGSGSGVYGSGTTIGVSGVGSGSGIGGYFSAAGSHAGAYSLKAAQPNNAISPTLVATAGAFTNAPLYAAYDQAGHARWSLDHNGLMMMSGQGWLHEEWLFPCNLGTGSNRIDYSPWNFTDLSLGYAGVSCQTADAAFSNIQSRYLNILTGNAGGSNAVAVVAGNFAPINLGQANWLFCAIEFFVNTNMTAGTPDVNLQIRFGLADIASSGVGTPSNYAYFEKQMDANTYWFGKTKDGTTETSNSFSGSATIQQVPYSVFRIELYGGTAPIGQASGARADFYINGTYLGSNTTHLPGNANLRPFVRIDNAGTSDGIRLGPVTMAWSRASAPPDTL